MIIDYVNARLAEGASVSTVRLEMAAIRGLFDFMIKVGAYDVVLNPAKNVNVRKPKSRALETADPQKKCCVAGVIDIP